MSRINWRDPSTRGTQLLKARIVMRAAANAIEAGDYIRAVHLLRKEADLIESRDPETCANTEQTKQAKLRIVR